MMCDYGFIWYQLCVVMKLISFKNVNFGELITILKIFIWI
jgi:hypothetical protein